MDIDLKNITPESAFTSCLACKNHEVINDPDPHDWFCADDKAVVCELVPNEHRSLMSDYASDRHQNRSCARSCRPYHLNTEATVPEWCPLKSEEPDLKNNSVRSSASTV